MDKDIDLKEINYIVPTGNKPIKELQIKSRTGMKKCRLFTIKNGRLTEIFRPKYQVEDNIINHKRLYILTEEVTREDKLGFVTQRSFSLNGRVLLNIFPPFNSKWRKHSTTEFLGDYEVKLKNHTSSQRWSDITIDIEKGARYRFKAKVEKGKGWFILRDAISKDTYFNASSIVSWNRTFIAKSNRLLIRLSPSPHERYDETIIKDIDLYKIEEPESDNILYGESNGKYTSYAEVTLYPGQEVEGFYSPREFKDYVFKVKLDYKYTTQEVKIQFNKPDHSGWTISKLLKMKNGTYLSKGDVDEDKIYTFIYDENEDEFKEI